MMRTSQASRTAQVLLALAVCTSSRSWMLGQGVAADVHDAGPAKIDGERGSLEQLCDGAAASQCKARQATQQADTLEPWALASGPQLEQKPMPSLSSLCKLSRRPARRFLQSGHHMTTGLDTVLTTEQPCPWLQCMDTADSGFKQTCGPPALTQPVLTLTAKQGQRAEESHRVSRVVLPLAV